MLIFIMLFAIEALTIMKKITLFLLFIASLFCSSLDTYARSPEPATKTTTQQTAIQTTLNKHNLLLKGALVTLVVSAGLLYRKIQKEHREDLDQITNEAREITFNANQARRKKEQECRDKEKELITLQRILNSTQETLDEVQKDLDEAENNLLKKNIEILIITSNRDEALQKKYECECKLQAEKKLHGYS